MRYALLFIACLAILPGCHTLKTVSHGTRDSVVLRVRDTFITHDVTRTKDSVVIRDSVVGVSGNEVNLVVDEYSNADTQMSRGNVSVHRYVDKGGKEHIDCKADSLTLVVANLIRERHESSRQLDSVSQQLGETRITHTEVTVKQWSLSWWGRLWASIEKYFAWWGLLCLVYVIYKLIRKFT